MRVLHKLPCLHVRKPQHDHNHDRESQMAAAGTLCLHLFPTTQDSKTCHFLLSVNLLPLFYSFALDAADMSNSCGKKHIFSPLKKIFTNPAVMYVNSPVLLCSSYSTPPLAPLTDRNKPAVWAATPREAG